MVAAFLFGQAWTFNGAEPGNSHKKKKPAFLPGFFFLNVSKFPDQFDNTTLTIASVGGGMPK
jgi:hypothetical protein